LKTLRLLALGCAATVSLAHGAAAFAKTQLLVRGANEIGASAMTTVEASGAKQDAAWAQISIYIPNGYTANLGQSPGTQIGTVAARVQLLEISADTVLDVGGTILVADKSDPALQASATQCTRAPGHAAIWTLRLGVSGQTVNVPVYVDPTSGSEATFSSTKLVFCLPQPYAKASPNYSPLGMKVVDATTTLSAGVLTNPIAAGVHAWRSLLTPWAADGAAPNLAATAEAQAIVSVPMSLSLKAKVKTVLHKKHGRPTVTNSVLLSGRLLEDLQGVSGARISFFANGKTAGTARTKAGGSFSKTAGLAKRTRFSARATVPTRETSCVTPLSMILAPAGCASATMAGYTLTSSTVLAAPRKR
jgi:hypothetical protein